MDPLQLNERYGKEFPFLPGVLALCHEKDSCPNVKKLEVCRISTCLVATDAYFGVAIPTDYPDSREEHTCYQLFAVKNGIVGEVYTREMDHFINVRGARNDLYLPRYQDIHCVPIDVQPPYKAWPVLNSLKGDEEYLVIVGFEFKENDYATGGPNDGEYCYERVITVFKQPKSGTLAENIATWKEMEKRANDLVLASWRERSHPVESAR